MDKSIIGAHKNRKKYIYLAEQVLVLDARSEYKALKAENLTQQQALDSDFISIF